MIIDSKVIAVDFDGTIVENKYPKIGKPKPFAFETLKLLQEDGHRLILWTVRSGRELNEALTFCKKNNIEFFAVNENYENEDNSRRSRKINADIFVDDRNVGGFPGWGEIYEIISGKSESTKMRSKKRSWFGY